MSTRIEWADTSADVSYSEARGHFTDQYGSENDGPALGVFTGSNGWVLEAPSRADMIEWLEGMAVALRAMRPYQVETRPEPNPWQQPE